MNHWNDWRMCWMATVISLLSHGFIVCFFSFCSATLAIKSRLDIAVSIKKKKKNLFFQRKFGLSHLDGSADAGKQKDGRSQPPTTNTNV